MITAGSAKRKCQLRRDAERFVVTARMVAMAPTVEALVLLVGWRLATPNSSR
jgi:hypothetical protein